MKEWLDIPAFNTALLLALCVAAARGWRKFEKGLNMTVQNLELLRARLESHEHVDNIRFTETARRLDSLEEDDRTMWHPRRT